MGTIAISIFYQNQAGILHYAFFLWLHFFAHNIASLKLRSCVMSTFGDFDKNMNDHKISNNLRICARWKILLIITHLC